MSTTLKAEAVRKDYPTAAGPLPVLRDVSLRMEAGQSASIIGPSGCGKSTLLNILGTLETPSGGTVTLDDCNPFQLPEPALARFRNRRIGFVFQEHHLLPHCSVLENVLMPALVDSSRDDATDRARQLIDRVGLADRLDHRPAELSGGECQRVAVARALINRPDVVLADEPTGNLDLATSETIAALMLELHREGRGILIVVTHNAALAGRFDRSYELKSGELKAVGP